MASRIYNTPKVPGTNTVIIAGAFAPAGTGSPTVPDAKAKHWSVARATAGTFTITFEDAFPQLISFVVSGQSAAAGDQIISSGDWDASAKTVSVYNWDISDAALADIAADANATINFVAVFRNGSI